MPAAAVIPAPIAYIKVVAVKKLVVGFLVLSCPVRLGVCTGSCVAILVGSCICHSVGGVGSCIVYCEKIRVFKAGVCLEYISME